MINAWSLAWEALNGTMDEEYPIKIDTSAGAGNTAFQYEDDDGLDSEVDLSTIDDQYSHHFSNAYSPYNDGWTQELSLIHI